MKCTVIETSPERTNAHPVTNENGTPHIYATISEARAELKANGYSYNRENQRYYIKGTEYRAYILREDSEEYAEIMEQAEQQAAPEYIESEHIQTVSGNKIYRSVDPVTGWNVFTVAGRDFWELAEARYFAQCNPTDDAQRAEIIAAIEDDQQRDYIEAEATAHQWTPDETRANVEYQKTISAANRAALALLNAYAEAIGEYPNEDDDETHAAYLVSRDDLTGTSQRASDYDRATVAAMVEAIADRAREAAAAKANQAANAAIVDANRAYSEMENRGDNENWQGWTAQFIEQAQQSAAEAERLAVAANDKTITAKAAAVSAMIKRVSEEIAAAAPIYQRNELLAYLGDPDAYDVEAIEAEATTYTADGARVWSAFGSDLAAIAERHEIVTYYAI